MYHTTEYTLIGLAVLMMSLGAGMFSEAAWVGFATFAFLLTLMVIWIWVRESDL